MVPYLGFLGISFDPTGVLTSLLGGIGNLAVSFFSYLLNEVNQLLNWLVSLIPPLPSWPGPSVSDAIHYILVGNGSSFQGIEPMLYAWNYYIALTLGIVLFFSSLGAEATLAAFKFVRWLLTHLPFGLGGGE